MKKSNSSLQKHQLKFERDLTKNYWGVFSMSLRISRSIKSARPTPHSNLATSWPQNAGFLSRWQRSGTYSWALSCSFHSFFPPHLSLIKNNWVCPPSSARLPAKWCPTLQLYRLLTRQDPLSMGFSRWEYWSGLPCPTPGDLLNTGLEPASSALAGGFFTSAAPI